MKCEFKEPFRYSEHDPQIMGIYNPDGHQCEEEAVGGFMGKRLCRRHIKAEHNKASQKYLMGQEQKPTHYQKATDPWELQRQMESSGNAFVDARRADAIKYCFRKKELQPGTDCLLEDLKKAKHCIKAAIDVLGEGELLPDKGPKFKIGQKVRIIKAGTFATVSKINFDFYGKREYDEYFLKGYGAIFYQDELESLDEGPHKFRVGQFVKIVNEPGEHDRGLVLDVINQGQPLIYLVWSFDACDPVRIIEQNLKAE